MPGRQNIGGFAYAAGWLTTMPTQRPSGPPVHVIGLDEVSRPKGQVYLTVVYDLERRELLGEDSTAEAVKPFFTKEMGARRCHTLRVGCVNMWALYARLVREHATNAQVLVDRSHIVKQ